MPEYEISKNLSALSHIKHGFFTRRTNACEDSINYSLKNSQDPDRVIKNREYAAQALGAVASSVLIPHTVHGNTPIIVDESFQREVVIHTPADAVITSTSGIAIGITYADCLPILVSSTDGVVVAAIHAGWRGIKCEVIAHTFLAIKEKFTQRDFIAAIGPHISADSFVVRDEVLDFFLQAWPDFVRLHNDYGHVDLRGIAVKQLDSCGVKTIDFVGGYTDQDNQKYFSYRNGGQGGHICLIVKN